MTDQREKRKRTPVPTSQPTAKQGKLHNLRGHLRQAKTIPTTSFYANSLQQGLMNARQENLDGSHPQSSEDISDYEEELYWSWSLKRYKKVTTGGCSSHHSAGNGNAQAEQNVPQPTAQNIYNEVVQALTLRGLTDEVRKYKLVGFAADSASVMQTNHSDKNVRRSSRRRDVREMGPCVRQYCTTLLEEEAVGSDCVQQETHSDILGHKHSRRQTDHLDTSIRLRRSSRKRCVREMDPHLKEYYATIDKQKEEEEQDTKALKADSDSDSSMDTENKSPLKELNNEEGDSDEENNMEQRRKMNLEDNAKFLASLGFDKEFPKPISKPQQKHTPINYKLLPRRIKSLRLQRITPDGADMPELPPPVEILPEHPRKPSGALSMAEYAWTNTSETDVLHLTEAMERLAHEPSSTAALSTLSLDKHIKQLRALRLRHVVKGTPNRIFSVGFHPSTTKVLALAGDKWGHLAFWDVMRGQDGIHTFIPHSRPVNHVVSPLTDPGCVFTASYDGTLRVTHLEQAMFDEVYATEEDDDIRLTRIDVLSPHSLIVAQSDGNVAIVDTRTSSTKAESLYPLYNRLIKCVNVHPAHNHYFLTTTNGGAVNLWDLRKLNKKQHESVQSLPHSKSVDAAHFSPLKGDRVLTTCYDNTLTVYDSTTLTNITKLTTIKHNNQTGRWLSNFRAEWHPQRDDLFVIGSMSQPRQIELYSTEGVLVHTYRNLSSVCSLNAFHPTQPALVGANSSGRLVSYL